MHFNRAEIVIFLTFCEIISITYFLMAGTFAIKMMDSGNYHILCGCNITFMYLCSVRFNALFNLSSKFFFKLGLKKNHGLK